MLPLTADTPKCLLPVAGRTILAWQLRALALAGVRQVRVVVGFGARQVAASLAAECPAGLHASTLLNPTYDQTDNLFSCLVARGEMFGDFLLINGDTLFEPAIVTRLLSSPPGPLAIAVSHKSLYDADDMKVTCRGGRVVRIGKDIPAPATDGEAIGLSLFRACGPARFREALEIIASQPDAARRWYLSAVNVLAEEGLARAVGVDGLAWTEIDYPHDLAAAPLALEWSKTQLPVPATLQQVADGAEPEALSG
jgi:choline kinase